jgi:hypothetical protein
MNGIQKKIWTTLEETRNIRKPTSYSAPLTHKIFDTKYFVSSLESLRPNNFLLSLTKIQKKILFVQKLYWCYVFSIFVTLMKCSLTFILFFLSDFSIFNSNLYSLCWKISVSTFCIYICIYKKLRHLFLDGGCILFAGW